MKKGKITIHHHRDELWYKWHSIDSDLAMTHGIKKSAIVTNLEKYNPEIHKEIHEAFPYIEKKEFEKLFQELVEEGLIKIKDKEI